MNIGADFDNQRVMQDLRKLTYYINLDAEVEIFVILRGILAGCVSISTNPSEYLAWAALVNGILAGFVYIFACRLMHIFEFDDPSHVS